MWFMLWQKGSSRNDLRLYNTHCEFERFLIFDYGSVDTCSPIDKAIGIDLALDAGKRISKVEGIVKKTIVAKRHAAS
jgi:hypothetical protein